MASRRQAHCRRRNTHAARRLGGIVRQGSQSSSEGPDESAKAAKASKAWKARRA